jgi:hypothetical protein
MGAMMMRDVHGLWSLHASEIRRSGGVGNGQAPGLDEQGNDREMPGLGTRQSDDLVLRIRRLLKERISTLGSYRRAVIVPNQGGPAAPGSASP